MTLPAPRALRVRPVRADDAPALLAAHRASLDLHRGWVSPCLDQAAFDAWWARVAAGELASLLATARIDAAEAVVGVCTFSQIALGNFRSACSAVPAWATTPACPAPGAG